MGEPQERQEAEPEKRQSGGSSPTPPPESRKPRSGMFLRSDIEDALELALQVLEPYDEETRADGLESLSRLCLESARACRFNARYGHSGPEREGRSLSHPLPLPHPLPQPQHPPTPSEAPDAR